MTRLKVALAALCLALCGACKLDVAVGIDARADGSGEVRVTAVLDRDAARMVGDVTTRLRTADLRQAGWRVDAPETRTDGSVVVVVRHTFDGAADAERALADLAGGGGGGGGDGGGGPFKGFAVRQQRTFWRTTTSFAGNVDLARGIDSFADAELVTKLGDTDALALGVPADQLERRLGASLDRLFGLQVAVKLPGRVESNAPATTANGAVWAPKLGEQASLQASAEQWNLRNVAFAAASAACALAALLVAAVQLRRRRLTSGVTPVS